MNAFCRPKIYLALVHHPVVNKNGDTVASAVTNLDLHDIARAGRTYGARAFYVVTPLRDQIALVERIVHHWTAGPGGTFNPNRREALRRIRIRPDLSGVVEDIERQEGAVPQTVGTCAREYPGAVGYEKLREALSTGRPYVLVFGTAWGLSETVLSGVDQVLEPVRGCGEYNHLSVRSAVSIILDRLLTVEK
ncbi:MAG: RNA methyltransferase [Desulfobacterales bacterium]